MEDCAIDPCVDGSVDGRGAIEDKDVISVDELEVVAICHIAEDIT